MPPKLDLSDLLDSASLAPVARDVFISHSSADAQLCRIACTALERASISCWLAPRDIMPSQTWSGAIVDGITRARVFVVALTERANSSKEVLREVELASQRGKAVLVWRLEDITPDGPLEYFLSGYQWLDAVGSQLSPRLEQLVRTVGVLLGQATPIVEDAAVRPAFAEVDLDDFGAPRRTVAARIDRWLRDR